MENGIVTKLKGVSMDISRQKQARSPALLETSERLKKITAQVPGVVYGLLAMARWRSAFLIQARACDYECQPEDLKGEECQSVFERIHPDDFDRVSQAILESAENQSPTTSRNSGLYYLNRVYAGALVMHVRNLCLMGEHTFGMALLQILQPGKETEEIVRKIRHK